MSWTHGEGDFTCLKGGQCSHCYSCYGLLILWFFQTLCILLLFSRVAVLLSTRHFCLGIPSPFKRCLLGDLVLHLSTFSLEAKYPPSATTLFLQQETLCCRVLQWRFYNTTSGAIFQRRESLFLWRISEGEFELIPIIFGIRPTIVHHLQCSPSP